ncbi:MAG: maleylacetoacetate isomerase [Thermaurantiacus sp.]
MRLFSYFRSTASWRVRIGLHWKGLAYETEALDLRTGVQAEAGWRARNPQGYVPALQLDDGTLLTQSLAILEWLEESHPAPPLLPGDRLARAESRSLALIVAADIHPIQNLKILARVEALTGAEAAREWAGTVIADGLAAYETRVAGKSGPFSLGAEPTLADICLVPQLANARRFGVDLAPFPRIRGIEDACEDLPAFAAARPEAQPDFDA